MEGGDRGVLRSEDIQAVGLAIGTPSPVACSLLQPSHVPFTGAPTPVVGSLVPVSKYPYERLKDKIKRYTYKNKINTCICLSES